MTQIAIEHNGKILIEAENLHYFFERYKGLLCDLRFEQIVFNSFAIIAIVLFNDQNSMTQSEVDILVSEVNKFYNSSNS